MRCDLIISGLCTSFYFSWKVILCLVDLGNYSPCLTIHSVCFWSYSQVNQCSALCPPVRVRELALSYVCAHAEIAPVPPHGPFSGPRSQRAAHAKATPLTRRSPAASRGPWGTMAPAHRLKGRKHVLNISRKKDNLGICYASLPVCKGLIWREREERFCIVWE